MTLGPDTFMLMSSSHCRQGCSYLLTVTASTFQHVLQADRISYIGRTNAAQNAQIINLAEVQVHVAKRNRNIPKPSPAWPSRAEVGLRGACSSPFSGHGRH